MAGMTVTNRSAGRWGFKCSCCQERPTNRKAERRMIKRRERQAVARDLRKDEA